MYSGNDSSENEWGYEIDDETDVSSNCSIENNSNIIDNSQNQQAIIGIQPYQYEPIANEEINNSDSDSDADDQQNRLNTLEWQVIFSFTLLLHK